MSSILFSALHCLLSASRVCHPLEIQYHHVARWWIKDLWYLFSVICLCVVLQSQSKEWLQYICPPWVVSYLKIFIFLLKPKYIDELFFSDLKWTNHIQEQVTYTPYCTGFEWQTANIRYIVVFKNRNNVKCDMLGRGSRPWGKVQLRWRGSAYYYLSRFASVTRETRRTIMSNFGYIFAPGRNHCCDSFLIFKKLEQKTTFSWCNWWLAFKLAVNKIVTW